jgi:hypothetical protein
LREKFKKIVISLSAFAKLHPDFIIHLKKNLTAMVNLLSGHVIPLTYYSAGLPDSLDVKTLYGNTLHIANADGTLLMLMLLILMMLLILLFRSHLNIT